MTRQLFLRHLAPTSPAPMGLEIERGAHIYLYDTAGKRYIDLISGIGPSVLGHQHAAVTAAIHAQTDRYLHTLVYGEFVLQPQVQLATLLAQYLPPQLSSTYLTSSGTEATEGAMKLAKRATGKRKIVSCRNAYHGSTQGAMSLMSDPFFTQAYRPLLPDIEHITFNNIEEIKNISCRTAAVIVETVQGEAGVIVPENDYLLRLREHCTHIGALLIFDEIQAGIGRTGSLFAFEQYGVVPDILLLAKGLGGGMPIGAFVASNELMNLFTHNPVLGHITTFGGHPVSAAAAVAMLQTITHDDCALVRSAKAKENIIKNTLQHAKIKALRTAGLWAAVDLGSFDKVQKVIAACLQKGVITDWFLFNDHSIRIAPPLVITDAELRQALELLLEAIDEL